MQHQSNDTNPKGEEGEENGRHKELMQKAKSKSLSIQQSTSRCIELGIPVCIAPYLALGFSQQSDAQEHVISIRNLDTHSLLQMCKIIIDNKKAFRAALKEFQQRYCM